MKSFEQHISIENGIPQVSEVGRVSLEKFNLLWVQIFNDKGSQVAEYYKPAEIPNDHSLSVLLGIVELHHENSMVRLRIVHGNHPVTGAHLAEPSKEDLFLCYFQDQML